MKQTTLHVTGMKCEGCVKSVGSALEGVEGVLRVEVSLDDERARVEAEPEVTLGSLVSAVESVGFAAKPAD